MHGDNDDGMVSSCIINAIKNLNVREEEGTRRKSCRHNILIQYGTQQKFYWK